MIKKYSLNVIGCGRLGKTLAFLLKEHVNINCILNRTLQNAKVASEFIGAGIPISEYNKLTEANIYMIATNDDQIEIVGKELAATKILKSGDVVFHCSGSLSSDVLSSARVLGALTASIHPNHSFAEPKHSISEFAGTICAIEGQAQAIEILTNLFQSIGANVFQIKKEFKTTYHAAGCIASNYLITLSSIAYTCYLQSGVPETIAKQIVDNLMDSTLKNLTKSTHSKALTGPIARGDVNTISKHMGVLQNGIKEIYSILGKYTLSLTEHENKEALLRALGQ